MRKRLALLSYRVARWLAPMIQKEPPKSLKLMIEDLKYQRSFYETLSYSQRASSVGKSIIENIRDMESQLKAMERPTYEQVKIEIAQPDILGPIVPHSYTSPQEHFKGECKKQLFAAVAKGLAESAEIEKFMYFRDHGAVKTVGIRLYLKHDDQ